MNPQIIRMLLDILSSITQTHILTSAYPNGQKSNTQCSAILSNTGCSFFNYSMNYDTWKHHLALLYVLVETINWIDYH